MTDENNNCSEKLEEAVISAYLDGELTQQEKQRVSLHLDKCKSCSRIYKELKEIRALALETDFHLPADSQWDEKPCNMFSALARMSGWCIIVLWLLVVSVYGLWQFATGDEGFWEKLFFFGIIAGFSGLFISVLIDRLKNLKNDKYSKVER